MVEAHVLYGGGSWQPGMPSLFLVFELKTFRFKLVLVDNFKRGGKFLGSWVGGITRSAK